MYSQQECMLCIPKHAYSLRYCHLYAKAAIPGVRRLSLRSIIAKVRCGGPGVVPWDHECNADAPLGARTTRERCSKYTCTIPYTLYAMVTHAHRTSIDSNDHTNNYIMHLRHGVASQYC